MDFIEGLLPFLLFIGMGILKSRRNSEKDKRNTTTKSNPSPMKRYMEDTKKAIQRQFVETVTPQNETKDLDQLVEKEDEVILNYELDSNKSYSLDPIKPVMDPITEGEIGKNRRIHLGKRNLVNSIIMSEVLGKPKALRK